MKRLETSINNKSVQVRYDEDKILIEDTAYTKETIQGIQFILSGDEKFRLDDSIQLSTDTLRIEIEGYTIDVKVINPLNEFFETSTSEKTINSAMAGIVSSINVKEGESVKKGDTLLVISAMKMENKITSPRDGKIEKVFVTINKQVNSGDVLISFFGEDI